MDSKTWKTLLHRSPDTHKYDYGHVLIVGGSVAMTGAAVLAGRAALRVGAGLVTIASTADAVKLIDRDVEELMTFILPSWEDVDACHRELQTFINEHQVSVLVIGPGLPRAADELIRNLLLIEVSMIVDAEVFTALKDHLSVLKKAASINKDMIATPHLGEYNRMIRGGNQYTGYSKSSAIKLARDYGITLVIKQHPTLVISIKGELFENTTGNPGLATAGSGDVLAGVIAGIAAQGKTDSYETAKMAVFLHGLAADIAVKAKTEPGMIASDVIEALPSALLSLDKN